MKNYTFIDSSMRTSSGFTHKSQLISGTNQVLSTGICHYINRTWEAYTFQSSRKTAVSNRMLEVQKNLVSDYKRQNSLTRLTKEVKEKIFAGSEELKELNNFYKTL